MVTIFWGNAMKSFVFGAGLLLATMGGALADDPAAKWWTKKLDDGTSVAFAGFESKVLTMTCPQAVRGSHTLRFEIPLKIVDYDIRNLTEADLVMAVDQHGGLENDTMSTARAKVSTALGQLQFDLEPADAWSFQSSIATSDWITIGVSPAYDPAAPVLRGITSFRTGGTAEAALRDVMSDCAPAN